MERKRAELIAANMIVIALAAVSFMGMSSIQTLYPLNNMITDDRTPFFEWSSLGDKYELLIDDDPGFRSPFSFSATGNSFTLGNDLDFGTYWWKVRNDETESTARKFTIVSSVELSRPEKNTITNTGNTELLVYSSGLAGAVTLAVNESIEVEEGDNVEAEQK